MRAGCPLPQDAWHLPCRPAFFCSGWLIWGWLNPHDPLSWIERELYADVLACLQPCAVKFQNHFCLQLCFHSPLSSPTNLRKFKGF